jgi:DNA-binding MarR family transcriptional regulator
MPFGTREKGRDPGLGGGCRREVPFVCNPCDREANELVVLHNGCSIHFHDRTTETYMEDPPSDPSSRPSLVRDAGFVLESLAALTRILQALDRQRAGSFGLSAAHWQALLALQRTGPLTVTGLGDRLFLEKSTASRLAKGLLSEGLVRKRSPGSDERKVILQVTELGIQLSRKILNELSEEYIQVLSSMEPEVGRSLPVALARLTKELARRVERA